jgi:predicted MFS family arabinose efflux permease
VNNPISRLLAAYRAAFAGLPRAVWLLAGATLVNRAGTMVHPFLALYLTDRLAFPPSRVAIVLALYGLGSVLGSLLGGWLTDRIGAMRVMQLALAGSGLGFLALAWAHSLPAIAGLAFLASLVGDAYRPALLAGAAALVPRDLAGRAMTLVRLAINLGMSVGPAVGGLLAAWHYEAIFYVDAVTCWAAAVVLAAVFGRGVATARGNGPASGSSAATSPLGDGPFLVFLALVTLLAMAFFQLLGAWPLHLRTYYHLSPAAIGALIALNAFTVATHEMLVVRRLENHHPLRVLAMGSFFVCIGFAVLPLGEGIGLAVASVLLWTVGEMLALPFANIVAAARAPEGASGRYMGAYSFAYSAAFALAPATGAVLLERIGPVRLWSGVGLLGVLLFAGFRRLAPHLEGVRRTA